MGLDMYLKGDIFHASSRKPRKLKDGYELTNEVVELGYWRKHWDLHELIVGTLDCEMEDTLRGVDISKAAAQRIIDAIKAQGWEGAEQDAEVFSKAVAWLNRAPDGEWRSIVCRGSW